MTFDAVNGRIYTDNMTNERVSAQRIRRRWLNLGCDGPRVATELGITRQAVHAMIERVNASDPLVWGEGSPDDQRAMQRAARLLLSTRGITFRTPDTEPPAI